MKNILFLNYLVDETRIWELFDINVHIKNIGHYWNNTKESILKEVEENIDEETLGIIIQNNWHFTLDEKDSNDIRQIVANYIHSKELNVFVITHEEKLIPKIDIKASKIEGLISKRMLDILFHNYMTAVPTAEWQYGNMGFGEFGELYKGDDFILVTNSRADYHMSGTKWEYSYCIATSEKSKEKLVKDFEEEKKRSPRILKKQQHCCWRVLITFYK